MIAMDWFGGLAQDIVTSALFLATGYLVGNYGERRRQEGKALTEYEVWWARSASTSTSTTSVTS